MKNGNPSIKKNFFMNAVLAMSSFLFPLITFRYVTGVLSTDGYGKVHFAISVINYFSMAAQLGIPTYGIRACAAVRDDKEKLSQTVKELLGINLVTCVISYAVLAVAVFTLRRFADIRILMAIVSVTILLNAIGMEWLYKGLEKYTYITVRSLIFKAIALGGLFLLVREETDYLAYGFIAIFAAGASNVLNFVNARKYITVTNKPLDWKRHMKPISVFFAMSAATIIYTNLDVVMLGFMKTDTDVAYYEAAVKVKSVLVSVVTSLGTVLLPRASYYIKNRMWDKFDEISEKAVNFVVIAAFPLAVYFTMFAKRSLFFLSGEKYAPAIVPMMILMPTLLLIGITNILGMEILVPLGREKDVLYSVSAGALTDLILNAFLIPKYASTGAAIGTLSAEAVVLIVQLWFVRDKIRDLFGPVRYPAVFSALAAGAAVSAAFIFIDMHNFLALVCSAILFFGAYAGVLLALKEPMMREIFRTVVKKLWKKDVFLS
ncbi:MAG: flippase [Erysipelotrichales bacterium]|nr:flippase [Erysipelotrichales bacterium]